ncbi:hypothetical protein [Vibrio phage VH7D]|uniref:Uncharacterized protein n=1 Tax=Vibrio phage VH7D TaxID=1262539 RepID=V9LZD8_9CAUD|nr:hypothetical protein CF80_gp119 [Vibrio phage VH7D]AGB06906.1 hypothetical protein [Vibrio phage VH7D]QNJ54865.1 hypothetical protein vBValMR10Z_325 [Vibrio phage vB_ValM_R10Z]
MQIDHLKLDEIRDKLRFLNNREKTLLMEEIMRDLSFFHGNKDKRRAAHSYMKIAHGGNFHFKDLKNERT